MEDGSAGNLMLGLVGSGVSGLFHGGLAGRGFAAHADSAAPCIHGRHDTLRLYQRGGDGGCTVQQWMIRGGGSASTPR